MNQCARCGAALGMEDDRYELAGETLCEDCYLDRMAVPKVCDPWAVYSAKKTGEGQGGLTERQREILRILEENGPVSMDMILTMLGIDEGTFRSDFAVLRHMELAKATKVGDEVRYTLFRSPSD